MITVPTGMAVFILGVILSLIAYIWRSTQAMISRLDSRIASVEKKTDCDLVTIEKYKEILDSRFNEFRLELYRNGVLKVSTRERKNKGQE